MSRLVLIRHGEAWAAVDRMVVGHDCRGLTPRGRAQAEALRDRLARSGELADAVALYASRMRRSAETAEIVAAAVGGHDVNIECGVCEIHLGESEGIGWDEWEERYGTLDWGRSRDTAAAPGAESIDEFVVRVGETLDRITAAHDGTVVVACHGGVVASAMEHFSGIRYGDVTRYVENTAITEFERDDDGKWWLVRFNDAAHVAEVPADA